MSLTALEPFRIRQGLDIFVVPNFLSDELNTPDPASLQSSLETNYPVRRAGEAIVPGVVQWVEGSNEALRYRGNPLKRTKIWAQRGNPEKDGYPYYYYTGVQWEVVPAQVGWDHIPEVKQLVPYYDAFCEKVGALQSNQVIVTAYRNGDHNIGAHFDKPKSIAPSSDQGASLITVVKMGEYGRPFDLYMLDDETPFWSEVVAPGTAIIMTLEANLQTKHAVPVVEGACGNSGSLVFRSIATILTSESVWKKVRASRHTKKRSREKKEIEKKRSMGSNEAIRGT